MARARLPAAGLHGAAAMRGGGDIGDRERAAEWPPPLRAGCTCGEAVATIAIERTRCVDGVFGGASQRLCARIFAPVA